MYPGEKNEILKMMRASLIIISPFSNYFPSPNEKFNNVPGYFNEETWVFVYVLATQTSTSQAGYTKQSAKGYERIIQEI